MISGGNLKNLVRNLIDFQRSVKGFDKEFDKETGGDRGRQQGDRGTQRKTKGDPPSQHKKK